MGMGPTVSFSGRRWSSRCHYTESLLSLEAWRPQSLWVLSEQGPFDKSGTNRCFGKAALPGGEWLEALLLCHYHGLSKQGQF